MLAKINEFVDQFKEYFIQHQDDNGLALQDVEVDSTRVTLKAKVLDPDFEKENIVLNYTIMFKDSLINKVQCHNPWSNITRALCIDLIPTSTYFDDIFNQLRFVDDHTW